MDIAIHFSNHRFRFFRIDYAIDMEQTVSQRDRRRGVYVVAR